MPAPVIAYAASAVVFFALDFIWLSLSVSRIYQPLLGTLLRDSPNLAVAAAFYLVYVVGLVVFAVLPAASAGSWLTALGLGALLGLVAYGTYDFTNLSTIRDWPVLVSVIDLAWGISVSAVSALAGYLILNWLQPAS